MASLQEQHVFSPSVPNTARIGFSRATFFFTGQTPFNLPGWVSGDPIGAAVIGGGTALNGASQISLAGTTGAITISAWMRPDTLTFSKNDGSGYVNWLGKGENSGANGNQEWYFRMYSQGNTEGRQNRISFYVFNPQGGLGIGSHFQDPVTPGEWIHVVGVIDGQFTYIYKDGVLRHCDQYRPGPAPSASCNTYSFAITPANGSAPLRIGTVNFESFFQGGIKEVRVWNRALSGTEVAVLYAGTVPADGLVAEYLLSGDVMPDTAGTHTATSYASHWAPQQ